MARNPLDVVGELLMVRIRDKSIENWERILDGRMLGETAETVRQELSETSAGISEKVKRIIPHVVDTVIHNFLWALEQEKAVGLWIEADGQVTPSIREVSDGLTGELYGERGWIAKFSRKDSS